MSDQDDRSHDKSGTKSTEGLDFLPPLEFRSIVVLLYFPALIHLGLVEDPGTGEKRENLTLAKREIDLLDLLKDKTKGNLEKDEEEFLEDTVGQLKMAYLKKAEIMKM